LFKDVIKVIGDVIDKVMHTGNDLTDANRSERVLTHQFWGYGHTLELFDIGRFGAGIKEKSAPKSRRRST